MNIKSALRVCFSLSILLHLNADIANGFVASSAPKKGLESSTALAVTIYGHPGSRSPLVNWACIELDVDFSMGDLGNNPHPFGQIPCLTDEDQDVVVFESGAILQYLLRYYAVHSAQKNGAIMSWIAWANASLDPICFLETPEGKVYDTGLKQPNRKINKLEELLSTNDYLVDDFSLADVAVSSYLLYVVLFFPDIDLSRWPNVVKYMLRCADRDAYRKAFGPETQTALISRLNSQPPKKEKLFGML